MRRAGPDEEIKMIRLVSALSLSTVLLLLPVPAGAQVTRLPDTIRYGFVDDHQSTSDLAIQHAKNAGFGWVKYVLFWSLTNPTHTDCNTDGVVNAADTCNYDWALADAEINRLANQGFNIYIHIAYPPTWSTGATYPNGSNFYCYNPAKPNNIRDDDDFNCNNAERRPGYRGSYPPGYDRAGDLRLFADIAARRYKDRARAWGFGAEVHSKLFWQGTWRQFFDEVLLPGYQTVKAVDPSLLVVGPEEDQIEERPGEIGAFEYLMDLEVSTGSRVFDIVSFHFLSQTFTGRLGDLDDKVKPLIDRTRRGRPFWITEFGYYAADGALADGFAAAWLTEMLTGIAARPWVDKTFVYRLMDTNTEDFGLLETDVTLKATYGAVQAFLAAQATPRLYYLAEGTTKVFFDQDVAIANPNATAAPVKVSFLKPDGTVVLQTPTIAARSRQTIHVGTIAGLEDADVSTIVESTSGLPLAVERTLIWGESWWGGHTDAAVQQPAQTWYFAEGSQGFFDTYILVANSNIVPANVTVTFLLQGGASPVQKTLTVGATSRDTMWAGFYPELQNTSFGILVEADQPIIAERSMYFGSSPFWSAGHESAGVTAPSLNWFLAEGATGPTFDMYVLVSNPGDNAAAVTVEFVTADGTTVPYPGNPLMLPGKSRESIYVDDIPGLSNVAVSTRLSADQPVVAERAMYWPGTPGQWYEAHNSFGVTQTGTRWVVAEGRSGTGGLTGVNPAFESYLLIYNTTDTPANVTVTYLPEGAASFTYSRVVGKGRDNIVDPDPRLANRSYGALIESDQPIVVERAMYWKGTTTNWGWGGSNATATKLQ